MNNKNIDQLFKNLADSEQKNFPNQEKIWNSIQTSMDSEKPKKKWLFSPKNIAIAASFVLGLLLLTWYVTQDNAAMQKMPPSSPNSYAVSESESHSEINTDSLVEDEEFKQEYAEYRDQKNQNDIYAVEQVSPISEEIQYLDKRKEMPSNYFPIQSNDSLAAYGFSESIRKKRNLSTNKPKETPQSLEFESRKNNVKEAPMAEIVMDNSSKQEAEEEYYFLDGEEVQENDLQNLDLQNIQSVEYMSNQQALQKGYLMISLENGTQKMLYWKNLDVESLTDTQKKEALEQMRTMNTESLSTSDRSQRHKVMRQLK